MADFLTQSHRLFFLVGPKRRFMCTRFHRISQVIHLISQPPVSFYSLSDKDLRNNSQIYPLHTMNITIYI